MGVCVFMCLVRLVLFLPSSAAGKSAAGVRRVEGWCHHPSSSTRTDAHAAKPSTSTKTTTITTRRANTARTQPAQPTTHHTRHPQHQHVLKGKARSCPGWFLRRTISFSDSSSRDIPPRPSGPIAAAGALAPPAFLIARLAVPALAVAAKPGRACMLSLSCSAAP